MPNPEIAVMLLPVPHPDVIARTLPDGCVLFHPLTEVYFGLNETGTVIWTALMNGAASEEALVAAVVAQWPDAPAIDVYCHVRELLADLSVEGLVVDTVASAG
ncbi:MAG: PqqD family protein [Gemmatimonadota bacterium]